MCITRVIHNYRQARLIYIVDKTVSNPEIEFIGVDNPTNTYVSLVA